MIVSRYGRVKNIHCIEFIAYKWNRFFILIKWVLRNYQLGIKLFLSVTILIHYLSFLENLIYFKNCVGALNINNNLLEYLYFITHFVMTILYKLHLIIYSAVTHFNNSININFMFATCGRIATNLELLSLYVSFLSRDKSFVCDV